MVSRSGGFAGEREREREREREVGCLYYLIRLYVKIGNVI